MLPRVSGRVRLLFVLFMMLVGLLPGGQVTAQDDRVQSVSSAATEISRIERNGDLLLLHDRLHLDVRLVVSRTAISNWYHSPDAVIPTADPEILSVEFGSWMWPVTGRTYADIATLQVRQPGTQNGVPVEQVELQHYQFDGTRWRWFFGSDAAFIDQLEQLSPPDATTTATITDIEYARVDMVWAQIFAEAGVEYWSPDDINALTDVAVQTGCGRMTEDDYSEVFYCRFDQEIYYLVEFQELMERQFGDYAWPHIISHEWGHHIQFVLNIDSSVNPELDEGLYDIELELQADCLAGVYAQEAVARGWLSITDLNDAYQISLFAADQPGTPFDDPLAHGTGEQRQQAFTNGLEDGLFGCNLDLTPDA